ncbi:MAG: ral nucleoside transport system permease protein [Thermoleophilaceae bacterium]|nr:ral nucleoside transport system permease protein [Thermoleophilaceae bacterium]MEA2400853.1 ral nucleoside transport system permease protein [Thermoleophilaceae bacterium]
MSPRQLGWLGIGLGVVAWYVTLPPLLVRTPLPSLVLAVAAVAAGVAATRGEDRRVGRGAIAAGLLGGIGAIVATRSGVGNLEKVFVWSALFAAMLRFATPLLFAALGGLMSERSGVINVGLEGMMLMGAFFGIFGADMFGSWVLGALAGIAAGGVLALVHAVFSIALRADQVVSGVAVNLLALGITGYVFVAHYGDQGTPGEVPRAPDVTLPGIKEIPFVGEVIGEVNLLTWVALLLVPLLALYLFRTPGGLRLRSVGEKPRAADSVGIPVLRTRYLAVIASGCLAGLGGVYLSVALVGSFNQGMTAGRGFIALAVVIFGAWRPFGALAGACLFGFSSAVAQRLPAFSESLAVLFQALPYVLVLIVVAGLIGRSRPPAAIGVPYVKE